MMKNLIDAFIEKKIDYDYIKNINYNIINEVTDLYYLSELNTMVGRFEESITILKKILHLNPDWIDVNDFIARNLWTLHDYDDARFYWNQFNDLRNLHYKRLKIEDIFTIDEVWTQSFGNFAKLFAYLYHPNEKNIKFYWHYEETELKYISNIALYNLFSKKIIEYKPKSLKKIITSENYITRFPFYCVKDNNNNFSHFKFSWNNRMSFLKENLSKVDILLTDNELNILNLVGFNLKSKFVVIHSRESGYWNRVGNLTHSPKNSDIFTYIDSINFLLKEGYQVVRIGDSSMKKLPNMKNLFDFAHSPLKNDLLDLFFIRYCDFMISNASGPNEVAGTLMTPVLAINWVPIHTIPYSCTDLVLLKKIKNISNNKQLDIYDCLKLPYADFSYYMFDNYGYYVEDNSAFEICEATKSMVNRFNTNNVINLNLHAYNIFSDAEILCFT